LARLISGCDQVGVGRTGLCGLSVGEQCGYDFVYLLLEVGLVQAAVIVEALAGAADGDLAFGMTAVPQLTV
jgi:hypothetical protein